MGFFLGLTLFCAKDRKDQLNPPASPHVVFIYLRDLGIDFERIGTMHSTAADPLDLRRPRGSLPAVLRAKFLSRRMPPRSGGIYMALEIEQERGGAPWEPLFSGAPTPDERRKRRSQEGGGGMPQILLLRNPSRALTPVKMDRTWTSLPTFSPRFFEHGGWLGMGDRSLFDRYEMDEFVMQRSVYL